MVKSIVADIPAEVYEKVCDWLDNSETEYTGVEDWKSGGRRIEFYITDLAGGIDESEARRQLALAGEAAGVVLEPRLVEIPEEDWSENWKRFFVVEKISPRLVVRPPWEEYLATADERVVVLNPGMSFGTGQHGTTKACMRFIDEIAGLGGGRSFLDIGCGSGILAIAARKLGFKPVKAFDNDPDAVRIGRENAAENGVEVDFFEADLVANREKGDVVAANVLAEVLCSHAAAVAASVKEGEGNALLISGILDTQYDKVLKSYARQGFREVKNVLVDEWRSGWLVRL